MAYFNKRHSYSRYKNFYSYAERNKKFNRTYSTESCSISKINRDKIICLSLLSSNLNIV